MGFIETHILTLMIFSPLLGALAIQFVKDETTIKWMSAAAMAIPLVLCVPLMSMFDPANGAMQLRFEANWIPMFNVKYKLGVDGMAVSLVLLTSLLSFLCIFVSWNVKKMVKGYFTMFLFLHVGMMGVFCALDFFLFYVFWEVMLLPMYFLVGIWGGEKKEYAAIKFFLYTLFGSVLMLIAMLGMYYYSSPDNPAARTFDLEVLKTIASSWTSQQVDLFGMSFALDSLLWVLLFIGFAVKVPVFPFHTWLPWAHVQAPTAVSVILAGVLLKMGTYGLLRFNFFILPEATVAFSDLMIWLGIINIIYGAFCAMAQKDIKKLVAYSSVSHMGYCLLGMGVFTQAGMKGAVLQMFNHGLSAAMMFMLVGVLYERLHHRYIVTPDGKLGFGGIAQKAPWITAFWTFAVFASLGLPMLNGFVSEALVFMGAFQVRPTETAIAAIGIVLGAAYLLWMVQRVFLGPWTTLEKHGNELHEAKEIKEISKLEIFTLVPLAILCFWIGIYPSPMLNLIGPSLDALLAPYQELLSIGASF